jgi:TetR/AcrR family transcriptional regulator, transcriptional repressor for nem operon
MGDKGRNTRRKIVTTALNLFSVKGFYSTSINDVLDAACITKGCLYGHFADKEALWAAAYEEAAGIWRGIVFDGLREINDPLERLERFIERDMRDYLGANVFPGGCFFLNMLVDVSGQSEKLAGQIWRNYRRIGDVLVLWLGEADRQGILKPGLDHEEISRFILVSLNGAAALYAPTKDPAIWEDTATQLRSYVRQLRK